jgi:hypothetical protein
MNLKPVPFLLLMILPLLRGVAHAESTAEVLSWCRPIAEATITEDGTARFTVNEYTSRCWGPFAVIQHRLRLRKTAGEALWDACPPEKSRRTQLVAVFVTYAEQHPERLHEEFMFVVLNSMQLAFPCR